MLGRSYVVCLCVVLSTSSSWSQDVESQVVNIAQGPVRGYKDPKGDFFTFHGIPFASAPTGTDRFKAPLPPPVWTEIFEATNDVIVCPQSPSTELDMREDCLVVNVYTPDSNETNLPVMIVVHGGAYQSGYGNRRIPKNLIRSKKIVVVTFNYRLGAHGFLCLGTEGAPGNAGMKDQVTLLRWVNANIDKFGGNPDDVTLTGCSAGGGSVDILTLSPLTRGLFNKAITESGACVGSVGVQIDPIEHAKIYASILNFTDIDDVSALEEFYRTAPIELLTSRVAATRDRYNGAVLFGPCLEADTGEERVIHTSPVTTLTSGDYTKVPLFYGFANMEGLMRISFFNDWKDKMNEKFSDFLPLDLQFQNDEEKERVAEDVKKFYFGEEPIAENTVLSYIDYFTDVLFAFPMLRALKLRIESNNDTIYLYEYSFADENTPSVPFTNVSGANHCDQLLAAFFEEENITDAYHDMKALMKDLWLNFIITGNPVPEGSNITTSWPAAGSDRSPHMSLSSTVELKGALLENRSAFWDDIYEKYFRAPAPPDSGASCLGISNIWIMITVTICYIGLY